MREQREFDVVVIGAGPVGEVLAGRLAGRGVEIHTGTRAMSVARDGELTRVELADGTAVEGDRLLVAVGRRPLTDDLGLETVGGRELPRARRHGRDPLRGRHRAGPARGRDLRWPGGGRAPARAELEEAVA